MKSCMKGKHFLWENDWSMEELDTLFKTAEELKLRYTLDEPTEILKNKTLFVLFFEESTRTRNACECGITQLGGHANYLTPKATQIDHGETAQDTIEVLSRMGHGVGIRNSFVGGHDYMRKLARVGNHRIMMLGIGNGKTRKPDFSKHSLKALYGLYRREGIRC